MKTRERYWGLYDTTTKEWLARDFFSGGVYWHHKPEQRIRYADEQYVKEESLRYRPSVVPRPFYVTRRTRPLPAEAQAVIDAVKQFNAGKASWLNVMAAAEACDSTCSTSSSS